MYINPPTLLKISPPPLLLPSLCDIPTHPPPPCLIRMLMFCMQVTMSGKSREVEALLTEGTNNKRVDFVRTLSDKPRFEEAKDVGKVCWFRCFQDFLGERGQNGFLSSFIYNPQLKLSIYLPFW